MLLDRLAEATLAKSPADGTEVSMLPPDPASLDTFVTVDAMLLCCDAMNSTGIFAVRITTRFVFVHR